MKKTIEITEVDGQLNLKTEGFNDIELIGLLSYYLDLIKVQAIQKNYKQNENNKTNSNRNRANL